MTASAPVAPAQPVRRVSAPRVAAARFTASHPEWWVLLVALAAWIALAWSVPLFATGHADHRAADPAIARSAAGSSAMPWMPGMADHDHVATGTHPESGEGWPADVRHWILMTGAMMLPISLPRFRRVAVSTIGRVRDRALAQTLLGIVAVWCAIGVVAVPVARAVGGFDRSSALALASVAWLLAALWQRASQRRRVLAACHRVPVPPREHETVERIVASARHSAWCVVACGPAMLALTVAGHSLVPMGLVTVGSFAERVAFRPRHVTRRVAVGMCVGAVLYAVLAIAA